MKDKFKSALKILVYLLTAIVGVVIVFLIYMKYNHSVKLQDEEVLLDPPLGQMVSVDDKEMHVVTAGEEDSDYTIVLMHGTSFTDSAITMKPLYTELAKDYRIAYVDRFGNGYSDDTDDDRDIATMLEETRTALKEAGVEAPYVLMPHDTAGVLTVYWANTYPDEVEAIVGLDMIYPEYYDTYAIDDKGVFSRWIMYMGCSFGIHRYVPEVYTDDEYDLLSVKEEMIMDALKSKMCYTEAMLNEEVDMRENATTAKEGGFPKTPVLAFLANPLIEPYSSTSEEVKESLEKYKTEYPDIDLVTEYNKSNIQYYSKFDNVQVEEISGMHAIYLYEPVTIVEKTKEFLDSLDVSTDKKDSNDTENSTTEEDVEDSDSTNGDDK